MGLSDHRAGVPELAVRAGQLQQQAEDIRSERNLLGIHPLQSNPQGFSPGLENGPGLRQHRLVHQKTNSPLTATDPEAEAHRFSSGGGLVQQRRIGNRQTGELADQSLKIEQCLQPSLGDFRLIGGVSRIPSGIFEDMPLDQRRGRRAEIPQADQGTTRFILGCNGAQILQSCRFAAAIGQLIARGLGIEDVVGYDIGEKSRHIGVTQG